MGLAAHTIKAYSEVETTPQMLRRSVPQNDRKMKRPCPLRHVAEYRRYCYHVASFLRRRCLRYDSLVEARFLQRINRFAATVELGGGETLVHVANSGRMRELLVTGRRVLLRPVAGNHRKTAFDLAIVDLDHALVSTDARLPNRLVYEAIRDGRLPPFAGFDGIRPEVTYGESRLDLALRGPTGTCYVEAKSVTLVEEGVALFPDAPTTRGRKHMISLARAVACGHRAAVVFVVQRGDAGAFTPSDTADPEFGRTLRESLDRGVEAYAYRCHVTEDEIVLADPLQIRLA